MGSIRTKRQTLYLTNDQVNIPDKLTWIKQPNLVTMMRSDYSLMQLRSYLAIMVHLQKEIESTINGIQISQLELFQKETDSVKLVIPLSDFGVKPDSYPELKQALKTVASTPVELETKNPYTGEKCWLLSGLFTALFPKKYDRNVIIKIDREIAKKLIDVSDCGWTKFAHEIAIRSKIKYTLRFYLLISSWKSKGGFRMDIDSIKKLFNLEGKYKNFSDLYKRVIKPARDELHKKSDCWFEVDTVERKGRKPTTLSFKVIKGILTEGEYKVLESKRNQILHWAKEYFKFKDADIKQLNKLINNATIHEIHSKMGTWHVDFFLENKRRNVKSIPKYILASLKNEFEQQTVN